MPCESATASSELPGGALADWPTVWSLPPAPFRKTYRSQSSAGLVQSMWALIVPFFSRGLIVNGKSSYVVGSLGSPVACGWMAVPLLWNEKLGVVFADAGAAASDAAAVTPTTAITTRRLTRDPPRC